MLQPYAQAVLAQVIIVRLTLILTHESEVKANEYNHVDLRGPNGQKAFDPARAALAAAEAATT